MQRVPRKKATAGGRSISHVLVAAMVGQRQTRKGYLAPDIEKQ